MFSAWTTMRLCLRISERKSDKDCFPSRHFNFAVLDLDKANSYPLNFICMLPIKPSATPKDKSVFTKTFGETGYKLAKKLLQKALKLEKDPEVMVAIQRRLRLLEPKPVVEKKCIGCGRPVQTTPKQASKRKYCAECLKKAS